MSDKKPEETKKYIKLCVACTHCIKDISTPELPEYKCARTKTTSLVTGEEKFTQCFIERASRASDRCGPDGVWFEPRR